MSTPPPAPANSPRILIAEDDATTRRLITFKLQREGYAVQAAENGEELIRHAAAQEPPALIVLDLMMPVRDGYSTLHALRRETALAKVPVIVLSGKNDEEEIVRCLKAGASDYMVKPFSPDELVVRIRKLTQA